MSRLTTLQRKIVEGTTVTRQTRVCLTAAELAVALGLQGDGSAEDDLAFWCRPSATGRLDELTITYSYADREPEYKHGGPKK